MKSASPVSVIVQPDPTWVPTIREVAADYCEAAEFPEDLHEDVVTATAHACTEVIRRSRDAGLRSEFVVKFRSGGESCVVEIDYDAEVPLNAASDQNALPERYSPKAELRTETLWIEVLKQRMDRIFFRLDGTRRVLEMRKYARSEGKSRQFWLMGLTAQLKPEVKVDVERIEQGDVVAAVLHDVETGRVLMVDDVAAFVVQRLDGGTTFYEIYMELIDKVQLIPPERLAAIFTSLERAGMVKAEAEESVPQTTRGRIIAGINKAIFRSLLIPHAEQIVDALYRKVRFVFHPISLAVIAAIVVSGFYALAWEIDDIHEIILKPALAIHENPFLLIELYVAMTLVSVLHEFSHGLTCRHFGGSVHRIGIMFYPAMIIFYVDVSSAWVFRSRWKRIAVAMAGPVLNLIVMAICFWIWHATKHTVPPEHSIWFITGFLCLYSTVINFIPFIKMDGYYILTDLVGIPTLREKSFAYLGQVLGKMIRRPDLTDARIRPNFREKVIFWTYGILGMAFTVLFIAYPIVEFVRIVLSDHASKGGEIFFGVIVALALYNGAYYTYKAVHGRLHRSILVS